MDSGFVILIVLVVIFAVVFSAFVTQQKRMRRWRDTVRGSTDRLLRTGATATATVREWRLARRRNPEDRSTYLQLGLEFTDRGGQVQHEAVIVEVDAVLTAQFTPGFRGRCPVQSRRRGRPGD